MSIAKDYRRQIAELKKRTDISKAEADRLITKAYKEAQKALKEELKKINASTPRGSAQAKLLQATQEYTQTTTKAVQEATIDTVQQVARQTAQAHVKAAQGAMRAAGAKAAPQVRIIASNEVNATVARTLQGILKGTVYPDGLPLSQRIWNNQQAIHRDIHTIIANAMAEGKSIADISDLISQYTNPAVYKDWNQLMADGYTVHRRNVEYNSQRLARTVAQHAYQNSTEDRARQNPFVTGFRWIANGSRACPICLERDGTIYAKGTAPLDHPNGMCILEPVIDEQGMDDRLTAWAQGAEDRELTGWGRSLGYEV